MPYPQAPQRKAAARQPLQANGIPLHSLQLQQQHSLLPPPPPQTSTVDSIVARLCFLYTQPWWRRVRSLMMCLLMTLLFVVPVGAQTQCGFVDRINFPVDTSVFRMVQDFGAPSARHHGRYHMGEDWYGGRDFSLGQPVRAIAAGRVTYSSAIGWGRDGGVVIIEHTFPDGSVAYSQYGHMMETDTVKFPQPYTCIGAGDIIAAVGDVRPAPHLHLEIRTNSPDVPGPGYSWEDPVELGWRRPSKFILNWQIWLQPAYRWRLDLADERGPIAPPLALDDHSLLYLDANRLGMVSSDGRSVWRFGLERQAVSVTAFEGEALLTYADGTMQRVHPDGSLGEVWEAGFAVDSAPITAGDLLVFHTPGDGLVAFSSDRREVAWALEDVRPVLRSEVAAQAIGLVTDNYQMLTVSRQGTLLDQAHLRSMGSLETAQDGTLLVYSLGGLWSVLADGAWTLAMEEAPAAGISSAVLAGADGGLYLFDGRAMRAYDQAQTTTWAVDLPGVTGKTTLAQYGDVLLLTSNHGHIIAMQTETGGVCGAARIYGSGWSQSWHSLGSDGILRVAVADQILGLNWQRFIGGCA